MNILVISQLLFRADQLPKASCAQGTGKPREGINTTSLQEHTLTEPLQGRGCVGTGETPPKAPAEAPPDHG